MNSEVLTRLRLIRYLTPVIVISVVYNINRFFEAKLEWRQDCSANSTCIEHPVITATKLRIENSMYNMCVLSIRCIVLGLFPIIILVFLNSKIYKDVQDRRARNIPQPSASSSSHRGQGVAIEGVEDPADNTIITKDTSYSLTTLHNGMSTTIDHPKGSFFCSKPIENLRNCPKHSEAMEVQMPLRYN